MHVRQRLLRSVVLAVAIGLAAAFATTGKTSAFIASIEEFFDLTPIKNAASQPFFTTVAWTDTGSLTAWYTSTHWTPNTTAAQWLTTDVAQFNDAGSAITAGINMSTASLSIGAIEVTPLRTRAGMTIGNSSAPPSTGTLTLNGAVVNSQPNVILRNGSSWQLTLRNNETGSGRTMNIELGNPTDNLILTDGAGGITISSVIGGAGRNLTVSGTGGGVLRLDGSNTYSGSTTIKSGGILDLGGTGSIANSTIIEIQGGGAFDVQSLIPQFVLGDTQTLKASSSGSTAIIATSSGRGFTTSSSGSFIFSAFNGGATAPLTISGTGGMALQTTNHFTVTVSRGGTPLNAGDYKLIAKTNNGFVTGTPISLTVNGDGVCAGCSASLVLTGGELFLRVAVTATSTPTSTNTPAATSSNTATNTPTLTQTATQTSTSTATPTNTSTATPVNTATATPTSTSTATPSNTPIVTTDPATNVTTTSAQLNGWANPNGDATFGHFRYSLTSPGVCDDVFGTRLPISSASDVALGAGFAPLPYSLIVTGLSPGATYYFCAVANNGGGTAYGSVISFPTVVTEPTVTTNAASLVTGTEAQLNGAANPNGSGALGWFRYSEVDPGTCNNTFGTRAPATGAAFLGGGASPVGYSQGLTGLSPGTTYFYCAIALNNIGFGFGPLVTFTTPSPPTTTTLAATNVTNTSSQLNGSANPNAALTAGWFRYSTTDPVTCDDTFGTRAPSSGGASLGSGTSAQAYSQSITELSAGTIYYYCAIATNLEGTTFGAVLSFTTTNAPPSPTSTDTPTATPTVASTNTPTNTATATPTGTPDALVVSLPAVNASPSSNITLPITVGDTTGRDIFSYDLQITYDPAVVTPMNPPFDISGTLSSGMLLTASNDVPGHLIVSAFQGTPLAGAGTLLKLNFTVPGMVGQSTTLIFADYTDPGNIFHFGFRFNDGAPTAAAVNGSVTVISAGTVSGTVIYGNAIGSPTPRFVSNVTITAAGSPNLMTTTGSPGPTEGQYSLTGFGAGAYTVTPTKTGGVNGITSFDAAKIAQHVAGTALLSGNQLIAADVSDNGSVSSFDAAQIARFASSSPPFGITGTWKFIPASRFYSSVTGDLTGKDYIALLMGDVSGNWTNTAARPAKGFDTTALYWLMNAGL